MQIQIDKIKASPFQPRLEFDLEDLKGSVLKDGILVPLTVRRVNEDHYELIDGERRLRLAKELEYKEVSCEVIKADNETADRMIWKVNTLRKDYKPKEKALHYKKHQEEGMSNNGIAKIHEENRALVRAYLHIFKLPKKYQELVWAKEISIKVIRELSPLINGGGTGITQVLTILDRVVTEKRYGAGQVKEVLESYREKQEKEIKNQAQELAQALESEIKIETPEDYEKAAEVLKKEAKKKREETMTPEEKAEIEVEKEKKRAEEKQKKAQKLEEKKRKTEERIEKKAAEKAKELRKEDLIKDEEFVEEVHREHEELEQRKLVEKLEGSRSKKPGEKPEMIIRIEIRQWIIKLTQLAVKIGQFRFEGLSPDEAKAVLNGYMLIYHELKKIFKEEEVSESKQLMQD